MTSAFTQFVARGVEVPAIDPRIKAHLEAREVVTADEGQAAPVTADEAKTPAPEQPSLVVEAVARG